jgi:hypothetical protein
MVGDLKNGSGEYNPPMREVPEERTRSVREIIMRGSRSMITFKRESVPVGASRWGWVILTVVGARDMNLHILVEHVRGLCSGTAF